MKIAAAAILLIDSGDVRRLHCTHVQRLKVNATKAEATIIEETDWYGPPLLAYCVGSSNQPGKREKCDAPAVQIRLTHFCF